MNAASEPREGTRVPRHRAGTGALLWGALWMTATFLGLAGCAHHPAVAPLPPTGDPVLDAQRMAASVPARDRVLWQDRTALTALRRGDYAQAKVLLDGVIAAIEGNVGPNREARKSRRFFSPESRKPFIGEPYERVMAYFYRGILYWMDGEPDNARACFRSAQLEDSDSESKSYASDYLLLDYLDGLASVKLKGDGSDAYERAKKASRFGTPAPYNPRANVLVFLEYGNGPQKYASGEYNEQLRFRPGSSQTHSVRVKLGPTAVDIGPSDDLNFQAMTRGGRVMDHILGNKAVFKSTTDDIGTAGIITGAVLAQRRETQGAALIAGGIGVLSKIFAGITTPDADTRCWNNLPQFLSFAALELPPGEHPVTFEFLDAQHRTVLIRNITVRVESGRDTVLFVSDHNS